MKVKVYDQKINLYAQSMDGGNYTQVPTIILKGQQLNTAGFEAGDYVEVEYNGDKITLTKTTPPETKSTKKLLEEKINELDSKQRKKLAKMIDSL